MNQDKPMTTTQRLKEALTGRNQDYGDVAELVEQIERELQQANARLADQGEAQANLPNGTDVLAMQNELEWLRRWNAPGKLNEAETCRAIAEAWRDEKCQQAYVLLRAHHEREAGKYANAHMAAIMVAYANRGVTQLMGERDQLRARVAELEADKARCYVHLNHLLSWASQDPTGPWNKEEIQRWVINEITSAIDVARAGKGAT